MLVINKVSKTYGNKKISVEVLKNIDLHIISGAFCAITGASGSGKTTLMNLIGLLDRPTSGCIEINSIKTEQLNDNQSARFRNNTIGFVYQAFHLLPSFDALDNVGLPLVYRGINKKNRREKARYWLDLVGLNDRSNESESIASGAVTSIV